MMTHAALAMALLAAPACTFGDGDVDIDSPYDRASIAVTETDGVADGETPVEVGVTGPAGAQLVLELTGVGGFVNPDDPQTPGEKTVFLDSDGEAVASIVSAADGTAVVSFKPDPRRDPLELEFHAVELAVGPAVEQELAPGAVVHGVCVALSSPTGELSAGPPDERGGAPGTVEVEGPVSTDAPAGLDCPAGPLAGQPVRGYAALTWTTRTADADLSLGYSGSGGASAAAEVALAGVPFPGYDVAVGTPDSGASFLTVDLTVSYLAAGELPAAPAEGVALTSRFLPTPGPTYLGSTSGDDQSPAVTSGDGTVTLFFDNDVPGTFAWFVELTGGAQVQVDDLAIP
jgi:hypothetical protein